MTLLLIDCVTAHITCTLGKLGAVYWCTVLPIMFALLVATMSGSSEDQKLSADVDGYRLPIVRPM